MSNFLSIQFWGLGKQDEFYKGIQHAINHLEIQDGIYAGDNLFTYQRNLSFLDDEKFMAAFRKHALTPVEQAILWRTSIVAWGARNGMRLEGDLVECACYKGTTARIVCDYLDFASHSQKRYYLYDLFEHDPDMPHHAMPEHGEQLYETVRQRFADTPNVTITKGPVPDVFANAAPEKVAFMHIDMNNAEAEIETLEGLFDRMVPGAVLILDDYGWLFYRAQKLAEDTWLGKRGYRVMELPTGQGLLIK